VTADGTILHKPANVQKKKKKDIFWDVKKKKKKKKKIKNIL